ncbi:transposase [Acrocarpospora corrugata]|uniref:Transposase n=1 Tax=Acrocarpospora corrugata TaxID=35763 RepID=A0A5M3W3T6_9ACTN|nr:DUF6262 family protein [Acrocarpospora corrugata]GES02900.1 transposase [Acrocarpospora corrugata]
MRADNTRHLLAAAQRRTEQTRARALAALRGMDATGKPVNFDTVSREAGVSRSWLYAQNDLRAEIQRLRERSPQPAGSSPPDRQRASEVSLLRRLEAATTRIRALEDENRQLRDAMARALGEVRAHEILGQPSTRDTPKRKSSKVVGPC